MECQHLLDTDGRLFANLFTIEEAQKIETDPILAERLDAFVSRFGRLQDTVGDKLLPALLSALAETIGPAIDNLDKAEKFRFIESADGVNWGEIQTGMADQPTTCFSKRVMMLPMPPCVSRLPYWLTTCAAA